MIHVMVGIVQDAAQQVLIALRPPGKPLAGLWEFPGGKLQPNEIPFAGLARELAEEVGIITHAATPWLQLIDDETSQPVLLDVWRITEFNGIPFGKEGQEIRWISPKELLHLPLPKANRPICEQLIMENKGFQQ